MGAPEEVIRARTRPGHFTVWPENWKAFEIFAACATQWRETLIVGPRGAHLIPQGLDYTGVEAVMRMLGVRNRKRIFTQIRDFERGALEGFMQARRRAR